MCGILSIIHLDVRWGPRRELSALSIRAPGGFGGGDDKRKKNLVSDLVTSSGQNPPQKENPVGFLI